MDEAARQRVGRVLRAKELNRQLARKLRIARRKIASVAEDYGDMYSAQDAEEQTRQIARLSEELSDLRLAMESDAGDTNPFPPRDVDATHEWARALFDQGVYDKLTNHGRDTVLAFLRHEQTLFNKRSDEPLIYQLADAASLAPEIITSGLNQLEYLGYLEQTSDSLKLFTPAPN